VSALRFIKKFMILYPELKYLLIVLKAFLKIRGLNETYQGGLSSYLLTTMLISYLQEIKKIEANNNLLLSEHLFNFFHMFGIRFNYKELGISIRNGGFFFLRMDKNWDNPSRPISL
jgi:non-canonical poly(A) RNA polymerase PAPD5/7